MDTQRTREVVERYFADLGRGDMPAAFAALSPKIEFELPQDRWNAVIPYLGRHVGVAAVEQAFRTRAETTEVLDYAVRDLRADGDTATVIVYTRAAHTRTRQEFEIQDAHMLVLDDMEKIKSWRVYFDPNGEIAAFDQDRGERLVAATWAGDHEQVAALLAAGATVDERDPVSGLTLLMIAAGRADLELVRTLLAAGADVHRTDPGAGATALHKACQGGSLEVVQALVDAGTFVDAVVASTGHTALLEATWFAHPDIVKYLLDHGAGTHMGTHYGFSLEQHFQYELGVNTLGKEGLVRSERYFAERNAEDARLAAAQTLMAAVTTGDVGGVQSSIAVGVDVDERFPVLNGFNDAHTPLLVASRDGHTDIVALLLAAGADVNATEPTFGAVPLHKAVYNGHLESTRIIAGWTDVDLDFQGATNGYTPLHDAIWHGFEECSLALVAAGASLRLVGHDGKTPLDLAREVFGLAHPVTELIAAKAT